MILIFDILMFTSGMAKKCKKMELIHINVYDNSKMIGNLHFLN